jgi:phenylacetate-CoA ligase
MNAGAAAVESNPLDGLTARRMGVAPRMLTRASIAAYQLRAIRQTVALVRRKSSFYAKALFALPADWPRSLDELSQAPLTSPAEVMERGHEFVCVPQSEISRVVTIDSSGTSGPPKRVFLTAEDQELALEFFAHGVASMAAKGDRMLIALPGEREGSVGFQIARGIERAGVVPIPHGLSLDPAATLDRMDTERATLLIGLPVQVLALALERGAVAPRVFRRLHTIVLCSDHVADSLVHRIRQATGCEVFEHYGSTEMGLGGGLDCRVHAGYHLREADLHFEIVSPQSGEPLADGELGEVAFTTLGRTGMPLIRYRTGDLARLVPGPCVCGSPLRRLERVRNRIDARVFVGRDGGITVSEIDEALFSIPGLHNFDASLVLGSPKELRFSVYAPGLNTRIAEEVERALREIPAIGAHCANGELRLTILCLNEPIAATGAKRKIGVQAQ